MIYANLSITLTFISRKYRRPGGNSITYRYIALQVTVLKSGDYLFRCASLFLTYGYVYSNRFDPSNPTANLVTQGQSDANGQLQFTTFLQGSSELSKRVCIRVTL